MSQAIIRALGIVVDLDDCMPAADGGIEYVIEFEKTIYADWPKLIEDEDGQKAYGCRQVGRRLHCEAHTL